MNNYVVLGDAETCVRLSAALNRQAMPVLSRFEVEIQDEWDTRRWFSRNTPHGVFVCVGLLAQTSVANFLFTVTGALNVIQAAIGSSKRIILVSYFPSAEFFLLKRLIDLYHFEKQVDAYSLEPCHNEQATAFADRCVLFMRDVSAKETHESRAQSSQQKREVRDQVVPQPESNENSALPVGKRQSSGVPHAPERMLEVSLTPTQGTASGDVCSQRDSESGAAAQGAVYDNTGSV
jgi:hypothetical protein